MGFVPNSTFCGHNFEGRGKISNLFADNEFIVRLIVRVGVNSMYLLSRRNSCSIITPGSDGEANLV